MPSCIDPSTVTVSVTTRQGEDGQLEATFSHDVFASTSSVALRVTGSYYSDLPGLQQNLLNYLTELHKYRLYVRFLAPDRMAIGSTYMNDVMREAIAIVLRALAPTLPPLGHM